MHYHHQNQRMMQIWLNALKAVEEDSKMMF
jgi:hypothetical protein